MAIAARIGKKIDRQKFATYCTLNLDYVNRQKWKVKIYTDEKPTFLKGARQG